MKKLVLFVLLTFAVPLVAMQPSNADTVQALQQIENKIIDEIIASGATSVGIYDESGELQPASRSDIRDLFKDYIQAKKDAYLESLRTKSLVQ